MVYNVVIKFNAVKLTICYFEEAFYYFHSVQICCQIGNNEPLYPHPEICIDRQIFRSFTIPQGELNVSLQRRSPPSARVVIWLSQTRRPFTFSRGFSCLFYCVKSIDRLDRNRHGCRIWSNGQKRGWPGKMTKQTWSWCVKKSSRTIVYLRPLRPLCCQNPDFFFSYWKPYIPWLDTKKKKEREVEKNWNEGGVNRSVFLFAQR